MPWPSFFSSCIKTVETDIEDLLTNLSTAAGYVTNIIAQAQQFLQVLISANPALASDPLVLDALDALSLIQDGISIVEALAKKLGSYLPFNFDPNSIPDLSQPGSTITAKSMIPLLNISSQIISNIFRAKQIETNVAVNWINAHTKLLQVYNKKLAPDTDYQSNLTYVKTHQIQLYPIPNERSRAKLIVDLAETKRRADANTRALQQEKSRYNRLTKDHTVLVNAHSTLVKTHAQVVQDYSKPPAATTPLARHALHGTSSTRAARNQMSYDDINYEQYFKRFN